MPWPSWSAARRPCGAASSSAARGVQVVSPVPAVVLSVVDLAGLPAPRREALGEALARAEGRSPFDLERGPLLRVRLLRLAPGRRLLLVSMHHIVSDAWSMEVFVRELTALYRSSPLPELPIQYADYAAWQREWLAGEVLAAELAWWRERLAGAPGVLALPLDRPRPPVHTFAGARRFRPLPPGRWEALERSAGIWTPRRSWSSSPSGTSSFSATRERRIWSSARRSPTAPAGRPRV